MDATGWAALATTASAVVVGWQAWETRRTAQAAEDALGVAREDLSSAQKSLALANRTLETTQAQHLDAVRARLDARAANLRVEVDPLPSWPPLAPSQMGGEPQPWPHGHEFRTGRDLGEPIVLRTVVKVRNAGTQPASVTIHPPLRLAEQQYPTSPYASEVVIEGGGTVAAVLEESRPLEAWMTNWDDRQQGRNPSNVVTAQIVYSDPWDNGVIDRWTLELTGVPVRPVDGDDAAWRLNHWGDRMPPNVWAHVAPAERLYFLSKARDEGLVSDQSHPE